MSLSVAGLVLAGGVSSRFGSEKAVAPLAGRPLLSWSLDALDAVCAPVAVSARAGTLTHDLAVALGREILADDPSHARGPLAGVAAGLQWAARTGRRALVTLPCDTPLVGPAEIAMLMAALGEASAAHAVSAGSVQGLCAVFRVELGTGLRRRLAGGDHSAVHAWLREIGSVPVAFAEAAPFRNVNTAADLERLEAEVTQSGVGARHGAARGL